MTNPDPTFPPVSPRPYLLQNQIQHYAWGTRDDEAFIPRLLGFTPEPSLPYAELWIGAHPKAPSAAVVDGTTVPLDQWIARHPSQILGDLVAERFSQTLPFLFKVLSAGEPLSIQTHPNRTQAEALHARDPEHYPDENHKPELAIALDALTALMGIRPFPAIIEVVDRYPELANFVGPKACAQLSSAEDASDRERRESVRVLFSTLIGRSILNRQQLAQSIQALARRLSRSLGHPNEEEQLFLRLYDRYTGADVGLFALFLLNLIHLRKGQGIFTRAGIPHAYIEGNIIECMANSDNVVRVGLTPKFKDAETLVDILDYESGPVAILEGSANSPETVYQTPASEFQVSRCEIKPHTERREAVRDSVEVLLVTKGDVFVRWGTKSDGEAETFCRGQSILIPACLNKFELRTPNLAELYRVQVPDL
jgi:mannose-6-phosphate isomerase